MELYWSAIDQESSKYSDGKDVGSEMVMLLHMPGIKSNVSANAKSITQIPVSWPTPLSAKSVPSPTAGRMATIQFLFDDTLTEQSCCAPFR